MMDAFYNWIEENLYALEESHDLECKFIYSLHLLLIDTESGGFKSYLMNSSGDYFSHVRQAFVALEFMDGRIWAEKVSNAFDGEIPPNRNERIDLIVPLLKKRNSENPFNKLSDILDGLIPEIEVILENLVQKKMIDSTWRPDPSIRLGEYVGDNR